MALRGLKGQISTILWNILNRPDIMDFVDVFLLAVLIYMLLVNVRHTRAAQTLRGIAFLVLVTWLSDVMGLRAIHAILTWLTNAGPVLLIILFQPEIQRILQSIGNRSVLDTSSSIDDKETIIDEVILALRHMSLRRVGALIVWENGIHLDDVIATGTRVDGLVSQPLLENIFEPKTPLHDGAVVVRENRVVAAACLLRLSDTTGVGRDLGTRHRAGIGVTEISDATVFIVSEETGIISMAEGGRLLRNMDEASLRQVLHRLYDTGNRDRNLLGLWHFGRREDRQS
jgi:diadenylate cyclase